MGKVYIAPSILGVEEKEAPKIIDDLIINGADIIHFDVMDGKFVPNTFFALNEFKDIKDKIKNNAIFDVHLMVENVEEYVDMYIENKVDIITFHYEAIEENKIPQVIEKIHQANIKAGISIKPNTDVKVLNPYLKDLDLILIMSVEPGLGGQKFNEKMLDKVSYLDKIRQEKKYPFVIEIDGGINVVTSKMCAQNGVDYIVSGSYILKAKNYQEAMNSLR